MNKVKRIGVVGTGNVGSALVIELARLDLAEQVVVAARNSSHAQAAILDAGSIFPESASTFISAEKLEGKFDFVIVTSGAMPHGPMSLDELLQNNFEITLDALKNVESEIIVVIGTPVDRLTEKLTNEKAYEGKQIIGFGGQLDQARMEYSLLTRGINATEPYYVIGEHGPRAIPVYGGEVKYDLVKEDTTTVLKRIAAATDKARNLATGVQLGILAKALCGDEQVLCVCAANPEYDGLCITWPYLINETGLAKRIEIDNLGNIASSSLNNLIELRKKERAQ